MSSHRKRSAGSDRRSRPGETDSRTVIIIVLAVVGGLLLLACIPAALIALLLPAVQQARSAARRTQSQNNLKQMGLAMLNFYDAEDHWVSGARTDAEGEPAQSWQTFLLPYIDQVALYQSIDLDIPWDDSRQGDAFRTIVPVYHNPSVSEMFTADGYATSHYAGNVNVLLTDSQLTMADVTDGTSNTIAAGEVGAGFKAWGDPTNLRDPARGIGGGTDQFGSPFPGGANMLFMDGSVRFISEDINPRTLQSLSTPDGGESTGSF